MGRRGRGPGRPGRVIGAAAVARSAANARPASGTDATGATRYQLRQRLVAIGDDFRITDQHGNLAYLVDGKALRLRSTLLFLDPGGRPLYRIQAKVMRVRDTMVIEHPDGGVAARVHNALITPLRNRWSIEVADGGSLTATGNVLDLEYRLQRGDATVATVSRRWFRVRDTYGVEIGTGEDHALLLAVVVVIDMMAHPGR